MSPDLYFRSHSGQKCVGDWGSAPDLTGRAYSAPPDSVAGLRGMGGKEKWGKTEKGEKGGVGKRQEREGKEGREEGKDGCVPPASPPRTASAEGIR